MSCSQTCWLLGGAWFQCRYGGFWMSSCWLMYGGFWMSSCWSMLHEFSGVLRELKFFLDLSLLPLVFSLIGTLASRLLHLYSTNDKTSRLMMKRFSTVRDTQRGSQSYMKKRRRRREIEVTTFQREWAAFLSGWHPLPAFRSCFVEFVQHSNGILMNLWGRKSSPYPIPPSS